MISKFSKTPCYVYDSRGLFLTLKEWEKAFRNYPTSLFFAVKANHHPGVLKLLFKQGLGADVVSIGELKHCLKLGLSCRKILFSGVGKTDTEIRFAIQKRIHAIQVESEHEFERICHFAKRLKIAARISFRINPNINVRTNPYIATGLYKTKFGIDEKTAEKLAKKAIAFPHVELVGISCHLGSQILKTTPFQKAAKRMVEFSLRLLREGAPLEFIDMGGGLGIQYETQKPPSVESYAKTLLKEVNDSGLKLYLEPGRSIVGKHGRLYTRIIRTKKTGRKNFMIVDAAMNDLIRPALYGAYHEITPLKRIGGRNLRWDVVGPICETGDFLGLDRKLSEKLKAGDILVIHDVGAYGMSMASHYNMRESASEILK